MVELAGVIFTVVEYIVVDTGQDVWSILREDVEFFIYKLKIVCTAFIINNECYDV